MLRIVLAALLLIVYPPPGTPNAFTSAGSASTAITASVPFRLRSSPQPQRTTDGRVVA